MASAPDLTLEERMHKITVSHRLIARRARHRADVAAMAEATREVLEESREMLAKADAELERLPLVGRR